MNITITMKTGEIRQFSHEPRAGGSYTKSIRYEGAFAIVSDEWGKETAIPAADIREVTTDPGRRY